MQKIKKPEPRMTYKEVCEIVLLIESGDVLLSYESWHFTSMFIPGKWDHAAVVFERFIDLSVIEAIGEGVQRVELTEWLYKKDHVMVLRRKNKTKKERAESGSWANDQVGKKYDYQFSKDDATFYCSELSMDAHDVPVDGIIEPSEIPLLAEYFDVIYSTL